MGRPESLSEDIEPDRTRDELFLSLDDLVEIFTQTLGSVRGSAGMVLWCWVRHSGMSLYMRHQALSVYVAAAWLVLVVITRALMYVNQWLVDGYSYYSLVPGKDIIVITGGSSGLGLLLSAMFSSDGFTTVNLDVIRPEFEVANSRFLRCDVSDPASVAAAFEEVDRQLSPPTVLINCAGIVAKTLGPLECTDLADIRRVLDTNLFGAIATTQHCLRAYQSMKMVVGISSSTALASPAFAGIYAASKAGVRTFFESLRHELKLRKTRVLCVTPGQLDTAMFRDVATPSAFLAPVLKSADVAQTIYTLVLRGQQGEVSLPYYSKLLPVMNMLPKALVDSLRLFVGVDAAAQPPRRPASDPLEKRADS